MEMTLFEQFMQDVPPSGHPFAHRVNALLEQNSCAFALKAAASGPVASYNDPWTKKVLINFVFRSKRLHLRVYADHASQDAALMAVMPKDMAEKMLKSPICRRLHDPMKCNARCPKGYTFTLRGDQIMKCRYSCFLLEVTEPREDYLMQLIERELNGRQPQAM